MAGAKAALFYVSPQSIHSPDCIRIQAIICTSKEVTRTRVLAGLYVAGVDRTCLQHWRMYSSLLSWRPFSFKSAWIDRCALELEEVLYGNHRSGCHCLFALRDACWAHTELLEGRKPRPIVPSNPIQSTRFLHSAEQPSSNLSTMSNIKVFFDITAGGAPVGRIVMELRPAH